MELYLVEDCLIPDFKESVLTGEDFIFNVGVELSSNSPHLASFKSDVKEKFGDEYAPIAVTLKFDGPVPKKHLDRFTGIGAWNVYSLKSTMLKDMQEVLCYGSDRESLKITVYLTCMSRISGNSSKSFMASSTATGFLPITSHDEYVQRGWRYARRHSNHKGGDYVNSWYLSIAVELNDDFIALGGILPKISDVGRDAFLDRKLGDFTIQTENGSSKIPCHRVYLSAKSEVLSRICYGEFKEAKEGKMSMEDMSTDGVLALLHYLYYDGIHEAVKRSNISFELLMAAEKYNLPNLSKAVETIITAKQLSWFDPEIAVEMFSFVHNLQRTNLKKKLLVVLASKRDEIAGLELLTKMYPTKESRDMFFAQLNMADVGIF